MKNFDYKIVEQKYPDSLSQNGFDLIFKNPDHGALNFSEIEAEFVEYYDMFFELEKLDYKNSLYQEEINNVDRIRNELINIFNQIQQFSISVPNPTHVKQNIINQFRDQINRNSKPIEDFILKIKSKKFFDSSEGSKAFEEIQKEKDLIIIEKNKIEKISEEIERYRDELKEKIKNTQFEKIVQTERTSGELESASFFEEQSLIHKLNADQIENELGWLQKRTKFEKYIYWLLGISAGLFLLSFVFLVIWGGVNEDVQIIDAIKVWEAFWDIRAGLFILSLLSIFYTGLYFATKNYSREKDFEYQNKNKSNIVKSVGLFSSGSSDQIRQNIYEIAARTIFSAYSSFNEVDKNQNSQINLSASTADITKKITSAHEN